MEFNRDKQIAEMANDLENHTCMSQYQAEIASRMLYAKGYRKASEVAEKIFEEIEHTAKAAIILLKFEKDEEIRNIKTECYTDLIGYIAELKKKYTQEK